MIPKTLSIYWIVKFEVKSPTLRKWNRPKRHSRMPLKNTRALIKLSNSKDCLQVLRAKKRLKDLDGTTLNLPSDSKTFINESLCGYYRGLWNKCKRLKGDKKIHQFYTNNGILRLKLVENGSMKTITHVNDLKDLFPDTAIDNLWLFSLVLLSSTWVYFVVAFGRRVYLCFDNTYLLTSIFFSFLFWFIKADHRTFLIKLTKCLKLTCPIFVSNY